MFQVAGLACQEQLSLLPTVPPRAVRFLDVSTLSMRRMKLAALQKKDGALKLSHFRRVKQLGSGDVGLVDLVQVQGDPDSRYAMKTLEKREMLERNKVCERVSPCLAQLLLVSPGLGSRHISRVALSASDAIDGPTSIGTHDPTCMLSSLSSLISLARVCGPHDCERRC